MFPHYLIERVAIETSHEEEDHAGTLPPSVTALAVFGEKKSRWETQSNRLTGARSLETHKLTDTVSER